MKVMVTGARGQLGQDVVAELARRGIDCLGVDIDDFDLTDEASVSQAFAGTRPDAVIHCAAYTAVDRAEDEPDKAYRINVDGTRHLARACRRQDSKMIYISTDYVFDGSGTDPIEADAPKCPVNHYGLTKSLGEDAVLQELDRSFIVRTAWVFGKNGANFVRTMMRLGRERDSVKVVADQFGSPTYTADLAVLLADMVITDRYGVYHATNEGYCSWYDFASEIMRVAGLPAAVIPITTDEYPTRARRPANSRLSRRSLDEAGFRRLPEWQDALQRYVTSLD